MEHYTDELPASNIDSLVGIGAFPVVDLRPWLKAEGEDLARAVDFLKTYVSITKPLILLTFSEKPSSVAASGFQHAFGYLSNSGFWLEVGRIKLVCCDDCWCIQIPCFHPAQARF